MGVKVTHGSKDNIEQAIAKNLIRNNSLVITRGESSELFFYDNDCGLRQLTSKDKFESLAQAQTWVERYDCSGEIISVRQGAEYVPYVVQGCGDLTPVIVKTDVVQTVVADNTMPISSAAVYTEIGNINALLSTI